MQQYLAENIVITRKISFLYRRGRQGGIRGRRLTKNEIFRLSELIDMLKGASQMRRPVKVLSYDNHILNLILINSEEEPSLVTFFINLDVGGRNYFYIIIVSG